jgi:leucyl/phenylalanyl-tRNA--protein transferase
MKQTLYSLDPESLSFPPLACALTDPNGLLAVGGDLSPQRVVRAYQQGIFPWYSEQDPYLWWSPDPRAIIFTNELRINRTLRKFLKNSPYKITLNNDFDQVISHCAKAPYRSDGVWIFDEMIHAYTRLHQLGYAHSIEVWLGKKLVGGLYGVAINGFFSGESMFYLSDNASKQALVALTQHLASQGVNFIDCQLQNPFLQNMGCVEVSRNNFLNLMSQAQQIQLPDNFWSEQVLHCPAAEN